MEDASMSGSYSMRFGILAAVIGAACLWGTTDASAETILTHRYLFDSDFSDSVGTMDGIAPAVADPSNPTNDAHVDTTVSSPVDAGVLALDGQNDRMLVPDAGVLPAGPFTLSWWAYLVDPQLSSASSYYFASGAGAISSFNLRAHPGNRLDGRIVANFGNGPVPVVDGWSHHVVTWTEEGLGLWYRNGVLVNDTSGDSLTPFAGLPTGTGEGLLMGDIFDSARYDLRGYMDDVQIYSGSCTLADAQFLYNNPGKVIPEPAMLTLLLMGVLGLMMRRSR
jgi:hypothetical protein